MSECTRDYFICNGQPRQMDSFQECFRMSSSYVYEVFRVQDGIPVFLEDHLDRLWTTAKLENIKPPFTRKEVTECISGLIHANPAGDGNIKISLTVQDPSNMTWLIYFSPHQYPDARQFAEGVAVKHFFAERNNPNAKVMDVALRSDTDRTKSTQEVYEVLLVDRNGFITEGSRSNVFFIQNNRLITPPVHTVLEGITRRQIMQICRENQIPVYEEPVHMNDLNLMDAVFITGTSRRVLPVHSINDMKFGTSHPLVRNLQQLIEKRVSEYLAMKR